MFNNHCLKGNTVQIATDSFILEDLVYIPMGAQTPVYSRPYVVSSTVNAIETISDRLNETRSGNITPNLLSGVVSEILQPATVGYQSVVNNDWVSTRRFIFVLRVKSIDAMGGEINSYIQGYTNYDGITQSGNIDHNLVHHINNVIETQSMTLPTPQGMVRSEKLYKLYNVFSSTGHNDLYTQRPADILENMNVLNVSSMLPGDDISVSSSQNILNNYIPGTISSSVDNAVGSEYLSKILTTGVLVNKSRDIHLGSYEISEQNSVDSRVPEPSINDNRFIKYLSRLAGLRFTSDTFNFGQLMQVDNTIFNRFKLLNITKDYVNPLLATTPEVGDYWNGQDIQTVKAYSLIESSVALATKYGFSKLFFTATNMASPTPGAEVYITNFQSFMNLREDDFNFLLEIFKRKFIEEVFLCETNSGTLPMHVEVYVDLLGTTKLNLTFAGMPQTWYTIPTPANSLFSPVVTIDRETFDYTTHQLATVIDTLSQAHSFQKAYF